MIRDNKIVFFNTDRQKIQVIQLRCRINPHSRISAAVCDLSGYRRMRQLFTLIAINIANIHSILLAKIIHQHARARPLLTIDIAHTIFGDICKFFYIQWISLGKHQSLLTANTADKTNPTVWKIFFQEGQIVHTCLCIEQVTATCMRLAATDRHDPAHRANVRTAHENRRIGTMHHICHFIEQRIVAADDNECILQFFRRAQEPHLHLFTSFIAFCALWHFENAVRFHE